MVAAAGLRVPPCSDVIQRPLDHLNGAGLLWRISGGKITAMQSDWATIEIDGVQHIVHRRPAPANFVLPWRRPAPWGAIAVKKKRPTVHAVRGASAVKGPARLLFA